MDILAGCGLRLRRARAEEDFANLKPVLIERFNDMVNELIGTAPYSHVLRIYREK